MPLTSEHLDGVEILILTLFHCTKTVFSQKTAYNKKDFIYAQSIRPFIVYQKNTYVFFLEPSLKCLLIVSCGVSEQPLRAERGWQRDVGVDVGRPSTLRRLLPLRPHARCLRVSPWGPRDPEVHRPCHFR